MSTAWVRHSPWDGHITWSGPRDEPLPPLEDLRGLSALAERRRALERLAQVVRARRDEAVDLLIREVGKVRRDAEAEVDLLPTKIATTMEAGWRRCPPEPVDGILWRPRGLAVVLGPFNFPLHLLHGLVVPAVAMGNPVVAKPSDYAPALGAWYRACIVEAGLAETVAVVLGGVATAQRLIAHPAVATVAAVGGRPMGQALARALADRPEVVLALELGGIGHALLLDDADLGQAIPALAEGAWRMAGQRCNATRVVHVPRHRMAEVREALAEERRRWWPGDDPEGLAGPLVDPGARDRLVAGLASLVPPDDLCPLGRAGLAPVLITPSADHPGLGHEHFGPCLALVPYDQEDEVLARLRANPARLSAAVWTADPDRFRTWALRLPYGLVGHNRSTSGARGDLPFGGCGQAGNGRPAGVAAVALFADETVWW